ncbi:hypothetical protein GGI01_000087 [Coemansia sp. RSA 376]|nr:hypothetical protein GGI14_000023 [Coemansia sp. S680]KAJ2264240.1 hypothetical protein GGI01_000087 [Coemansia sp. RSA 376]
MPIFGQTKRNSSCQGATEYPGRYSCHPAHTNPFERKSLAASLSSSVKTLFSKRISGIISEPPMGRTKEPLHPSQVAAVSTSAATTNPKRQSAITHSAFVKRVSSTSALGPTSEFPNYDTSSCPDRYSQARARVLAETVRRLQQTTSPSPATPSSISTGKTLSFFPEESEYDSGASIEANIDVPYELSAVTRAGITRFASSCSSSASSSRTFNGRSRPTSMTIDGISGGNSPTATTIRPQSMLGCSRESLGTSSSITSFPDSTRSINPGDMSRLDNCDRHLADLLASESRVKHHDEHSSGLRYSVAMSQSLSRRFQTRLAHEYEQRIYCLHSHYSDVIERMEARARQDSERCRELEKELSELRKVNASLSVRETELSNRLCQQGSRITTAWPLGGFATAANTAGGLSKKLVEFVDHYQDEVQRLTRETSTAQEWVVTLAELVIGPKPEHQSWDEWLNVCLETLQKRREQQKEEEWLERLQLRNQLASKSHIS